jgi:2'-hydroxyisoflavone reductase
MMNDGERAVYGISRAGTSFVMNVLLVGGYRFLGRALIASAQARGHRVSAFNRGSLATMPGVEQLTGDRDAPAFAAGRRWDVAIDTSAYIPRHLRATAEQLNERVERYIFVSSISAYRYPIRAGVDETSDLAEMPPGADPDDASERATYGARKAACEALLETLLPGRAMTVRAGFIVGPYDNTGRFNSWIERAARPGPLLVPGDPAQPLQLIDARDLADWTIAMAERGAVGTYNATGPERPLRLLDVAQTCIDATGGTGAPLIVPSEELKAAGVVPWEHIPFWLEPGEYGIMEANIDRAFAAGLRFRPLADTVRDTHAWLQASDHTRQIVFPPALEAAAISRFRAR